MGDYSLAVYYAFARSGGTLINRCLASIPGNLVLSEMNPHAALMAIERQADEWLGLIHPDEVSAFAQLPYGGQVVDLARRAGAQGCHLIIRDWPALNFLDSSNLNVMFNPSFILEQCVYLETHQIDHRALVMARRAADIYDSIKRNLTCFETLTVDAFGQQYLAYARAVTQYPIVHYESFCANPTVVLQEICRELRINYNSSFMTNFHRFDRCTGDNLILSPSRGSRSNQIVPLKSNTDSRYYQEALGQETCREADSLLGYGTSC
jgi:hypothetical protein